MSFEFLKTDFQLLETSLQIPHSVFLEISFLETIYKL
jgi:hypothetical protein